MNLLAAQRLGVYPLSSIVAVDDTPVGIEAGRNAGMKTIGVTLTGNLTGLSESEVQGLTEVERDRILATAGDAFTQAGADLVLPSVARLPWVLGLQ
jgi:phosphonoacetaldehyde hydrolase